MPILPLEKFRWPRLWQELWAERAAILEFDANLPRAEAEAKADLDIRRQAEMEPAERRRA